MPIIYCSAHEDMAGTRGRPALAHRNICLENLHLKADGRTLCIGGLEYAICAPPSPPPLTMEQLMQAFEAHLHQWAVIRNSNSFICTGTPDCERWTPVANAPLFPNWWPICGLQVGLPTYMAPEVSINSGEALFSHTLNLCPNLIIYYKFPSDSGGEPFSLLF